jgi:hypothetical protein
MYCYYKTIIKNKFKKRTIMAAPDDLVKILANVIRIKYCEIDDLR